MMVVTYYSKSFIIISCSIFLFSFLYNFSLIHAHGGASHDNDESSPPHGNLHSNSLIRVKIWCLLIFFFATFFPGISPYYLRWNESFLILGTQFSAGVFFATALLHFLSDASSTFETLTDNHYPFSYMLVCAGYLLTMLTDLVVAYVAQKSMVGGTHQISGTDKLEDGDEIRSISNDDEGVVVRKTTATAAHNPILIKAASFGDSILLILALCFHSVFEGIAVGIADNEADAWRNLWTILLHKVFAAIAMGIALLRMIPKRPFLTTVGYSFAFAISSPVGIGIGIAINATTQGKTSNWIFAISMSLACGIFIYVAINHLIAKGYKPADGSKCYFDTPIYKYLALVLGVFVISVVMNWD